MVHALGAHMQIELHDHDRGNEEQATHGTQINWRSGAIRNYSQLGALIYADQFNAK